MTRDQISELERLSILKQRNALKISGEVLGMFGVAGDDPAGTQAGRQAPDVVPGAMAADVQGVRVRIVALRARHFFHSAAARIGNASNRRKGLAQVVRETRIYQGISEPARNVTGFLTDLLRMCQV
jgi:hypothetical protein